MMFSQNYACPDCNISIEELTPRMFSFNNPYGACPTCTGLGMLMKIDPAIVIPDRSKSLNDGAIQALTFFARTAMNDFSLQEIEPTEMIGHFMECDVTHDVVPSNKNPGKTTTFARLSEKRPSEGWIESAPALAPAAKPKYDLSKLLD